MRVTQRGLIYLLFFFVILFIRVSRISKEKSSIPSDVLCTFLNTSVYWQPQYFLSFHLLPNSYTERFEQTYNIILNKHK